jgi:glucuronate isomerase
MDPSFLPENYLLSTRTSEKLYFEIAQALPLFDYHCHIPPAEIADNRRFENLTRIWLADGHYGDHYKWRAMRANGIPEPFITGDADDYDKFLAYARTVPAALRNPLYHWTHLELRRYFGITELLNEESAPRIWAQANEQLQELTVHRILEKFRVTVICTTDDPTDDLAAHQAIRTGKLPKMILYSVNPADNYVLGTMIGNFQDGSIPGKLQFGIGWWFLDQKEGMEWQLNALSNVGLLSRFVGMLTDSRSFMSYPRHEYFRRILCNLLGMEVERGEIPNGQGLLGSLVRGICFENAKAYFGLECGERNGLLTK